MAAPQLISTNLTGSTGFDGREALRLTFSEPIQAGSGWVSIYKNDGTLVERLSIATSSRVSLAGPVLTITPTWALESSANHYLTIDAGAVRDANGNGYAGLTAAQPLSFRTGAESLNNTVEEPFRNTFPNNTRETIGEHSFLYVRTTFADQLNVPWSEWTWRQDDAVVEEYWALNSNGRVSITSAFAPLATIDRTSRWYSDFDTAGSGINGIKYNNVGWLWEEGLNSAFAYSGYDFANFDAGVVGNDDWARYGASFGGGRLVLNAWTGWEVLAHEAGHELGFGHPGLIATPFGGTVGYEGYSRMGGGLSHYHLWEKNAVGWIDPSQILTDPQAGNYRIAAFDRGYTFQSDINLLSFKGAATGSTPAYDWSVQYRSLVNEVSDSLLVFRGSNDRLDDPIKVGETFRVPNGNAYITTLSKGDGYLETAVRYGLVAANGSSLDNIAPVVSFTANARAVKTGESASFSANAYDADGNALTYTWTFSDGVTGQGAIFTRSFNQSTAGTVTATLTANDLRGGSVSTSAAIAVGAAARDTTPLSAGGSLPVAATRSKPLVTLQSRDAFADENGDTATLVLERFGTSLDSSLTVALAYSGSGVNDVTSGSKPATITFAPGQKTVEFQVSMLDDTAVEPVERLTVSLAANSAYDISGSDGSSWVTLYDNDLPKVRVEAIDAVASEGGRDFGTFLISRTGPLDAPLKVNYNQFGTALHGSDYAALTGEVTIAAGQRSAVVMIQPIDNDAGEPTEYVSLILPDFSDQYDVDPAAFIAKIAILDNDKPQVQAYIDRNGITEGQTASVTIEAQGQIGSTVTVRYALSGTATAGSDYTAPSGSVNVVIGPDGIGWASVPIPLIDDTTAEPQETVVLTILESEDYGIGTDRKATFVVQDNDSTTPVVMISPLPDSATEGSGNPLRFYIERSGTSGNLVVNYQLMGTATAGVDYSGLSGSVTIPDGQPGAIITATPINDSLAEGEETITVRLLPSATYQLGIANTATLAISDDEQGVFGVGFYLPKQETQWLLVEGGYPTADGKQRNTSLRVADIVPSAFTYTLNGDSITNKDGLAFVNPYKTVATAGQLSFWVETLDDTYTKAVRVLITDSANGVLVKATEARYKQGDVRGTDWIDSGTSQSVAAGATNAGYGISGIKAVDAAIPAAVAAEAQTVTFQQTKLRIAETQDPLGNVRDVVLKLSPLPLSFGTASTGSVGAPLSAKVLTGQTFTAAQLGIRNRLDSIAIDGLATAVNTSDLKLKVWAQTGDVGSFAPGALVATSRAVRTSGGGSQVSFDFGGEQLSSGAVYAFSLVGADGATVPFSSTLTSRTDGQIGDGRAFAQQVAGLLETRWSGNSAYNNNDWSATPQYQDVWSESASPVNVGDNYSRRLTGLLKPTVTGNYTFYIASDDSSRLFLSTDATAANKVQIASVATGSWTNPQQWNKFSSQTSAVRTLQAGQTYYLEVQHQEVGGGDHVAVAWQGPGMTEKALISAANLAPISPISAAADVSYTVNLKAADTATPNNTVSVKVGPQSGVYHSAFGGNIDYTFLDPATNKPIDPPTVVFAPGETEKVVRIRVNPDGHTEGLESFTLGLSNIAGAAAQPNASQLRVEITDRTDAAIAAGAQVANRYVRLLAERSTLREDAGSDPKLIVALDRPAGNQPITVTLQASGTATAGADYTYDSTVTFLPGEVSKPVNFALIADSVGEGIETIRFTLSEATGALVVGPSVYEITVMDKDAPQILELIGFSQRTDSAGTVVGQFLATPALSKTITSWEILSGNPRLQGSATPAFAIDSQGRITVANPDALPLSDYQFKLAVRATDNTGASNISSATITVGGRQIVEERWNNRNVYNNNQWDQPADIVNGLSAFDAARNVADSYSRRITGVFTVPTSGSYTFWIAADDAARLTIAPYSNPGSEQQIAGLTNAVSYQDWTGQTSQQSSLQNLVAGQRYILRAYQREDGGGDHLSVAWSGPGFNRRVMAASDFLPAQATAIVNTPRYSDSTPASVSTFSLASSAATNTGLTASVASGSFTRDNTLGLSGSADANAVVKIYDGASYLGQTVAQANGTWALTTPTLADGSHTLRAEILDPFGNIAITSPTTYTIRTQTQVGNLQLLTRAIGSSNVLTTGSPADQILDVTNADQGIVAYGVLSGAPFVEQRWDGSSVYNNNSWDSVTPNYTGSLAMLVTAIDVGNNYSRRITGSITVPTSGQYTFYIASDDNSRLYLSTDSTAANKVQIAGVGGSDWTNPQQWDKYSSQKSAAINLQAGQSYYIEVQHLEGAGGDHAAVGWTGPGITQITPIALPTSLLVSDVINGAKLVDRSLTSATSSAGVSTTYADTSSDGRFVVFGTSSPASFGNAGTGFSDTESRLNGTYSDLIVVDRQTGSMRLATSGSNATTTRSRQSQFVGLTADSQYLIYSTDYAEAIADFSTPGKPQPSAWALVDGGYPTTSGKSKTTSLRVADIDPLKLTIAMAGGSIDNDGVVASVSSPTISRSTGSLSFWVQAYDDVYTKAVRLVLEDTATGIVVKATQAKYTSGNQTNFNWTTSGNGGNVATSLNAGGYGVSLLEVQGANLTDSMKNEGVVASRDLIAYNLATGEQRLLSHSSATDSKQSQASNISNATLSAGGRYVLFSANNATKLGNNGVPFSDSAAGVADLFAADLQTNQIRLLSHTAASGTTSAAVGVNLLGTSADDRFAIFSSNDASAFGFSDSAPTASDLFAVNLSDGTIRLISRAGAGATGTTSGQSVGFEQIVGNYVYFNANDATKLGFSSDGDTSKADLFRYNLNTGAVELLSRTTTSATAALNAAYQGGSLTASLDGRYVAFVVDLSNTNGGFTVGISGSALMMLDTLTGALRMLNASNGNGTNLSYAAWSGIEDQVSNPRYFTPDSKTFVWQTSYSNSIAIFNKSVGPNVDGQYGSVVLALDLSGGLAAAGNTQLNRVLSHTANGVDQIAPSVNLLGVSADSRLAFFSAGNASAFGNDAVAFSDSNTSANDIIAVDLTTRRLELVSGANGESFGQAANYQGLGQGGSVLFSLGNVAGISTLTGTLTDTNGTSADILARRFNLIDLVNADDSLNADGSGSRSDNITSRSSFTLESWATPGMAVDLLDGNTVVASQTAGPDGRLSWQLTNVANGVHVYSLQYAAEGIPIRLSSPLGASSLTVKVQAAGGNQFPTGSVIISGTPTQGQSLTAVNTLADVDGIPSTGPGAIAYQWKANGTAIAGATGSTYVLTQAEVGKTITVTASYTDNGGTVESVTSTATSAVANINDAPTGSVTISGTPTQGQTLTAANTLADADGIPSSGPGAIAYQWKANGTAISGATSSTYVLTQAEVGKAITVTASYTDNGGSVESVTSTATGAVANAIVLVVTDSDTAANSVSEAAAIGTPVGLTVFAFEGHEGGESITMSYSLVDNAGGRFAINATTGVVTVAGTLNYSSASSHTIKVRASSSDGYQQEQSFTIAVTKANSLPTGSVSISGTATQGQTLTAANTLADPDGIPSSGTGAIAYQWKANGTAISGATSSTYVLTQAEVGKAITVTASYTDNGGTAESVTSAATAAVAAPLPVITLGVSPTSVTEDGVPNLVYTFTRSGPTASPLTVNYTIGGSANALDYTGATPGSGKTISFDPGSSTATLVIDPTADAFFEADETVILTLVSASTYSVGTPGAVTGTITNDDALPTVRVTDASIPEGNSGTKNLNFLISLSTPSGQVVTVDYATANNTATAGSDYTSTSGSLTIQPGATSGVVSVPILGDTTAELDETFFLNLTNATGGVTIARGQAIGTIINDDGVGGLVLTGTSGPDTLTGSTTNDTLTGLAGADILDGQGGADTFVYTALTDSLLGGRDSLRSFNPGEGDRIKLPNLPTAVFYGGSVAASISAPAVSSAYAAAGAGGLAPRGAVFFATGSGRTQRLYLSVNDGTAAFDPNSDLVMEVTGMVGAPSVVGALTAANYFI